MNTKTFFILMVVCFACITGCGSNSGTLISERLQVEHRLERQMERDQERIERRVQVAASRPSRTISRIGSAARRDRNSRNRNAVMTLPTNIN